MKEYILFLDESKANKEIQYFCLGGCIIEKENYINNVIPLVTQLKENVFGNKNIILHETEIRGAKNLYKKMLSTEKRNIFWNGMSSLFTNHNVTSLGVVIDISKHNKTYPATEENDWENEEYFIAFQIILENFLHFLLAHNGIGKIYIESRNTFEDKKLQRQFYSLLANGSLFYKSDCFQTLLSTISFPIKEDNNIGLQIADFVPNVLKKKANNLQQRKPSIQSEIIKCLYDGNVDNKSRFGMKIVP